MIKVTLQLDGGGCLRRLQSEGHAVGQKGSNIVCAAATALMRSAARVLADHDSIVVSGHVPLEGVLEIEVDRYAPQDRAYLLGVTEVLVRGLQDLALEEPTEVSINLA